MLHISRVTGYIEFHQIAFIAPLNLARETLIQYVRLMLHYHRIMRAALSPHITNDVQGESCEH